MSSDLYRQDKKVCLVGFSTYSTIDEAHCTFYGKEKCRLGSTTIAAAAGAAGAAAAGAGAAAAAAVQP